MMKNVDKLNNFLTAYKEPDCVGEACSTGVNDLSMSYRKKISIIKDVIRGRFHNKKQNKTEDGSGDIDTFVPTQYNQTYAYYRTYHQLGDIDTKNISLYSTTGASTWRTNLVQGSLMKHLNNIKYRKFIDKLSRITAGYGNGITKIVDGIPYVANLLNVVYDNRLGDIQKSPIAEYFALPYHEALKKAPQFSDKIDEIYEEISQDGYNEIQFIEFWSWYKFGNSIKKGVATFLVADPSEYSESERFRHYVSEILANEGDWEDKLEVSVKQSQHWKRDAEGKKVEQLFPYVVSEAFPVDDEIRSQGIIELIMPLQARFNQLMERLDRLFNSSLSGIKLVESEVGFEFDVTTNDLKNAKPDEYLPIVKDKQDIRPIVDQSIMQEGQAILEMISFIKNMMNEISGVTNFSLSAEMNQSAKATTAASITSASQTPFKKFIERMSEAHSSIIGDFILPYILEKQSNNEQVLADIPQNTRQEIIREAAENELNRNWDKFNKAIYNESKKQSKANPELNIPVRGASNADYESELGRIIAKNNGKTIKYSLGEWAKRLGSEVVVDIDNEFADKERKFNSLIQLATVPMVQNVMKAEELVTELLRNSDIDNYDFIKSKDEQINDAKEAAELEVFKNVGAQAIASQQGGFGAQGGRPENPQVNPQQNRIDGQGIESPQPVI